MSAASCCWRTSFRRIKAGALRERALARQERRASCDHVCLADKAQRVWNLVDKGEPFEQAQLRMVADEVMARATLTLKRLLGFDSMPTAEPAMLSARKTFTAGGAGRPPAAVADIARPGT